jgi:hypothetical protein
MRASLIAVYLPGRATLIRLARAALAVAGAAACSAFVLAVAARSREGAIVRSVENGGDWYARSPAWYVTRGIYGTEHAPDGAPFAWTSARARISIPGLERGDRYRVGLRARSGRGANDPPAIVRALVDGLDAAVFTVGPEWQDYEVPVPAGKRDGVVVLLETQETFTPGQQDPRALAFMIDRLTLTPVDGASVPVPRVVLLHLALFAGAIALAAAVCAFPAWLACATGTAAGAAGAWLVLFDSAFLGRYSERLDAPSLAVLAVAIVARAVTRLAPPSARPAWRAVIMLALFATTLRFAVFLHPAAPVSDGMFHVHRAQAVRGGNYLFTSVTPRPFYEFPYPVGLYVAAQPLWDRVDDRLILLRGLTLVTDALVALALFAVVAGRWKSTPTGIVAAALALAVPVVVQGVSTANLTNVFAQSCFTLAILWIGGHLGSAHSVRAAAGAVALLTAAYLSHFSTAVIGTPAVLAIAAAAALARDDGSARAWRWIAISAALAAVLSYVIYYSHFHAVYARTLAKIGSEGTATSLVATLAEHSESKPVTMLRFLVLNYGWAALALALGGGVVAVRRNARDGWTLILIALGLTVAAFLALGAFTPVEMRANLAAHPVIAALAAAAVTRLWVSGRLALRVAAVAGVAATVWLGIAALKSVVT